MPAEWLIPTKAPTDKAILYLHGGGFASGSINSHRAFAGLMAREGQVKILIIDYRLAPENPYPAALEDARLAYEWMLAQDYVGENIFIAGDSAGGALALSMAINLKDNGAPLPGGFVLLSPLTDIRPTGRSFQTKAKADPWLKIDGEVFFKHYLADNDPRSPMISPLYGDLTGLPQMLIFVGQDEILLSDSTRLAEKARDAGVKVKLKIWPEMWHVFPFFAPIVPESARAVEEIGEYIQETLSKSNKGMLQIG